MQVTIPDNCSDVSVFYLEHERFRAEDRSIAIYIRFRTCSITPEPLASNDLENPRQDSCGLATEIAYTEGSNGAILKIKICDSSDGPHNEPVTLQAFEDTLSTEAVFSCIIMNVVPEPSTSTEPADPRTVTGGTSTDPETVSDETSTDPKTVTAETTSEIKVGFDMNTAPADNLMAPLIVMSILFALALLLVVLVGFFLCRRSSNCKQGSEECFRIPQSPPVLQGSTPNTTLDSSFPPRCSTPEQDPV